MQEADAAVAEVANASDAGSELSVMARLDQHSKMLDPGIRLTQMADAKATPVLALQAALATVAVNQASTIGTLLDLDRHRWFVAAGAIAVFLAYVLFALFAWAVATLIYLPRAPRASFFHHDEAVSLVYFDDIRRMPFDVFRGRANASSASALEADLVRQVHTVSNIAAAKMLYVRWALLSSVGSLVAWLLLIGWARA